MTNKIVTTAINNVDDCFDDFSTSLQEFVDNIIKQEKYLSYRLEKKIIPQLGNFLSRLYEVDITGETIEGEKVTHIFIKKAVTVDKITLANVSELFYREIFIYNELSRTFLELQDAANVPVDERFKFLKIYNTGKDVIIMENLSKTGFNTYTKTKAIPLKFAELSIIQLAKFHVLSYVMKKYIPEYFNDKIKVIENPSNLDSDWEGFLHNICSAAVLVTKGEAKAKITNYASRMIRTFHKYIKDIIPSNGCLCHGDYKFLNIMVKEVDGEVVAVQPIDYQLVYYGSPVNDFFFFIFSGTDQDFRRKHLKYLKDLYFENFTKFLGYFNMDVDSTYSRQEFENDYKERLELGLVFGLFMAAFTFAHTEEGFDVQKVSLSELPIIPDYLFADRVEGIIEDYIDWGYL